MGLRDSSSALPHVGYAASTPGSDVLTTDPSTEQISDAALLDQCRDGRDEAWDILVDRYERLVFSVAVRNGLSSHDAVDVAQHTFTALLESLSTVRRSESLAWWLMTVARRQSWRIRNRGQREVPYAEVGHPPEDPLVDWERTASVHQALQQLGNPCRDLLIALYFEPESPSYAEIARRMGRSIGGIGPMRGRCLARLRSLLGEDGAE